MLSLDMGRVNYAGLVVAGIGFVLTRFTVTLTIDQAPVRFYLAGVVPLVLGLGLSAFGAALAVADIDRSLVRTTAVWCVFGVVTMLVLVVLTLLGSSTDGMPAYKVVRSQTYLSNFLIGGSVGGTLTGLYAARNRRQRAQLRRQTTQLEVLNDLLRHEVLNALTAIRGYASLRASDEHEAERVIETRSDSIEETIEEVQYLTESAGADGTAVAPIPVEEHVEEAIESVVARHPDADVTVSSSEQNPTALANNRLGYVFTHLIENAVVHTDGENVSVSIDETAESLRVTVSDDGPGLPPAEQRLLEVGDIDSGENPGAGFGLYFVRFLVDSYDGSVETAVDADGTDITVVLPKARVNETGLGGTASDPSDVRPAIPHLIVIVGAALVAGSVYGIASGLFGGSISGIGVLYGTEGGNPIVGWITHQFHSVVFGFVFAGLVTVAPDRYHDNIPAYVGIGTVWGFTLWVVASGFISAIWLRLVGIPVPVPSYSVRTFAAHITWGPALGLLTALGYRHLSPVLARYRDWM
jgi:two-component system OmpR family sensor kinase